MRIGVISALESEHKELACRIEGVKTTRIGHLEVIEGELSGNTLYLLTCGIAKVNAAIGATILIETFHPDCIVSTGVAGGIDTSVRIADVVASRRVAHHDVWCGEGNLIGQVQGLPLFYESDERLLKKALALNTPDCACRVHEGDILTGEQFISNQEQLLKIKSQFPGGKAVDMESAALAQTCHLLKVPFISFRIVSDLPGSTEDNFKDYIDFFKTLAQRSFDITWRFLQSLSTIL